MTNGLIPDMKVPVGANRFHGTHDTAWQAKEKVQAGNLGAWTNAELANTLSALEAGDRMSALETGPDAGDAPNYYEEIKRVQKEMARRS